MNAKTETVEKNAQRLVTEARLLDLLFPDLPQEQRPTRRTLLSWRTEGVLPYVKMGRGTKAKVFYNLDGCLAAVEKLTMRARRKGRPRKLAKV